MSGVPVHTSIIEQPDEVKCYAMAVATERGSDFEKTVKAYCVSTTD